jgi:hypothetical protein
VGRSRKMKNRVMQHGRNQHSSATFAAILTLERLGFPVATYNPKTSRKTLRRKHAYRTLFPKNLAQIRQMDVRLLAVEDDATQAMFELYAALALKTPYNSFRTS